MRFTLHGSDSLRGIKIEWDVPVEINPEIRAAMAPHDVDNMHAGILRRGYAVKSVTYPSGSLAFRIADGHEIFLQLPVAAEPVHKPIEERPVEWTVDQEETCARHRVVVTKAHEEQRADILITKIVTTLSRAVTQRLIDQGCVTIAGQPIKKSHRLQAGDVIEIVVPNSPAKSN